MLIEYTVKNFRSFRDEVVLSMVADKKELANKHSSRANLLRLRSTEATQGNQFVSRLDFSASFPLAILKPCCRILA